VEFLYMQGVATYWSRRVLAVGLSAIFVLALAACQTGDGSVPVTGNPVSPPVSTPQDDTEYKLGTGDKIRVITFGEKDLSGEFELDGKGVFSLPLVGQIGARGLTLRELETKIADKLRGGYLRNPRVSVEVMNYRPFYIQGEVKNSGEYPYKNGLTVQSAVAMAGGYTYRARTSYVFIRHAREKQERQYQLDKPVRVLPGDNVRVPERFF
jgi:polysaccharide export outer membrane protein